ncbi:MAG: hypothetical protein QW582_00820, partial [Candidatus Micrarchaeaceae archaeon]
LNYKKRIEFLMPLLTSLHGPGVKMSSSIPGTYIKINASETTIKEQISKAYCPEGIIENNPILEIVNLFILPNEGTFIIKRDNKFGGDIEITSANELNSIFAAKKLHPLDLKNAVSEYLVRKLSKVRNYFESNNDLIKQLGPVFGP